MCHLITFSPSIQTIYIILDAAIQYCIHHLISCKPMFEFWLKISVSNICSIPSTNAPISKMSRSNSANVYHFEINVLLFLETLHL